MATLPKTEGKLREFTDNRATDLGNANRSQSKTGLARQVEDQQSQINDVSSAVENIPTGPVDDDVPPSVPTGVVAYGFQRAIAVQWSLAPASEYVDTTIVRLIATETGAITDYSFRHRDGAGWIDQIEPRQYSIQVRNVDIWEHTGSFTPLILQTSAQSTVDYLVADRIFAGTLQAAVSIVSGGFIASGGARMDAAGINLQTVATEFEPPQTNIASKITPNVSPTFASFQFFDLAASRGIYMRSDGIAAGSKYGAVFLEATGDGVQDGARSASISIRGGATADPVNTFIKMKAPFLQVTGAIEFVNTITQAGGPFSITNGGEVVTKRLIPNWFTYDAFINRNTTQTFDHGFGALPSWVQVYVGDDPAAGVKPIPNPSGQINVSLVSTTGITIENLANNKKYLRMLAFR